MSILESNDLVCVTGASGYIASELVASLLVRGLRVNGTVRSIPRAAHLLTLPGATERLKLFEADLLGPSDAFAPAFAGCKVIFHTACPFVVTSRAANLGEEFFVAPAVKGTESVLDAAGAAAAGGSGLRRVVLTSSAAAIFKRNVDATHVYDEATWNDPVELATRKMWCVFSGRRSVSVTLNVPLLVSDLATEPVRRHRARVTTGYSIGKTLQERAAWAWMEAHSPPFSLVAINPCMVAGAARQPTLNASLENVLDLCNGSKTSIPNMNMPWIHLTDVVDAHIAAGDKPDASGRYLMIASWSALSDSCTLLREGHPALASNIPTELDIPAGGTPAPLALFSSARVEGLLGRPLMGLKSMLDDSIASLLAFGHLTPPGVCPAVAERFCGAFTASARLELRFGVEGGERGRPMWEGGETTPTIGAAFPDITLIGATPGACYTYILSDADAPSVADPKFAEWQHWVHVNALNGDVASGESVTTYFGPAPGKGNGRHRYALTAYEQTTGAIEVDEPRIGGQSGFPPRRSFNSRAFATKYKLKPVALVSFFVEYDDMVPELAARLAPPAAS